MGKQVNINSFVYFASVMSDYYFIFVRIYGFEWKRREP